jgi:hypothetical protein
MSLAVQLAEFFKQDFANQFAWYVDVDGPDGARRFQFVVRRLQIEDRPRTPNSELRSPSPGWKLEDRSSAPNS